MERKKKTPGAFGATLRVLRAQSGLSQAALAELAGVSPGYIGLIETGDRGERPSLDIVRALGQALGAGLADMESLMRAAGHLGPEESLLRGRFSLSDVLGADGRLTTDQRKMLLQLYNTWTGGGGSGTLDTPSPQLSDNAAAPDAPISEAPTFSAFRNFIVYTADEALELAKAASLLVLAVNVCNELHTAADGEIEQWIVQVENREPPEYR